MPASRLTDTISGVFSDRIDTGNVNPKAVYYRPLTWIPHLERLPPDTGKLLKPLDWTRIPYHFFSYNVCVDAGYFILFAFSQAKLFDRDPETNEVLWFASPPLNMSHAKGPRYSLVYMQFLAAKRRRMLEDGKRSDEMHVDTKAGKRVHPQTITEITRQVLSERPLEGPV